MSRLPRILALLALLALASVVAAYAFLDVILERYRPWIEARIEREIGMALEIGAIDVRVIPDLGLRLSDVAIEPNPDACEEPIRVKNLDVLLDLFSLRSSSVRVSHLRIIEPRASMTSGEAGLKLRPRPGPCVPKVVSTPPAEDLPAAIRAAGDTVAATHFDIAEVAISGGELILSRFDREIVLKAIEFRSGVEFGDEGISFRDPELSCASTDGSTRMSGRKISYTPESGRFALDAMTITDGDRTLTINGALSRRGAVERLDARLHRVELRELMRRLHRLLLIETIPEIRGTIDGKVAVTGQLGGKMTISGSAALLGLELSKLKLTLQEAALSKATLEINPAGSNQFRSGVRLRQFALLGRETYQAEAIDGTAAVTLPAKGFSAGGDLDVSGFLFDDGATKVAQVDAALRKITVDMKAGGDITAAVTLDGRRGTLTHSAVEVRSLRKISGPITVRVPAAGGYEVKGPVSAEGGAVKTLGHEFTEVSGKTTLRITGPLKEFNTESISTKILGETVRGSNTFTMTEDHFIIGRTPIDGVTIHLLGQAKLGRRDSKSIEGSLSITQTELRTLAALYSPLDPPALAPGNVRSLRLRASGTRGALTTTLAGTGSFEVERPPSVPAGGLGGLISGAIGRVPVLKSVARVVLEDNTRRSCAGTIAIDRGTARFPDIACKTGRYSAEADVSLALSGELSGRGEIILLRDTAKSLGLGLDFLNGIFGKVAQLKIPIKFGGKLPEASAGVDMTEFVKRYSGYSAAQSVVGGVVDLGVGVGEFVLNPFRRSKPTPAPGGGAP